MAASIFNARPSHYAHPANAPKTSAPQDLIVSRPLSAGMALRLPGAWLTQRKARLTQGQLQLLNVALAALAGRETVTNIQQDELGGSFNLARPSYGASNVCYQRGESTPDTLVFLSISDHQGKPLLTLGNQRLSSASADTRQVVYRADKASILAHSRYDPQAAWQNRWYIVPFFTHDGETTKVVGDYIKGDALRFEVKNEMGDTYAVLKRTRLDSGGQVWMLPEHASIKGGATKLILYTLSHGPNQAVPCHLRISSGRDARIDTFIDTLLEHMHSKPAADHRAADAVGILNLVKGDHHHGGEFHFMTCSQEQKPIGLMVVEKMDHEEVYIHHVITDSDYPGTAKAMIQQAASMAIAHSTQGRLTVSPLNAAVADSFERNYGFTPNDDSVEDNFDDEDDLVLKPAQSPLWQCLSSGEAKLK